MEINGRTVTVHGAAISMLGDTPASNYISRFKEGVGFAFRKCRRCLATNEEMIEKVMKNNKTEINKKKSVVSFLIL